MIHVVLFQPEIPPNTGNIIRTCMASNAKLHLIKPLGFRIDDASFKRAGLDYLRSFEFETHENFDDFLNTCKPNMESGSWSGEYFVDYPISVTAAAKDGYRFVGWKGSIETKEEAVEINLSIGEVHLDAVFEKN